MVLEVCIKSKLDSFALDVSFETTSNRIGILGESGAGKSMFLKYIAGIYTPEEGRVCLDGQCIFDSGRQVNVIPQERNIAYMFQSYALFPTMTVRENIEIIAKGDKAGKKEKTDFLLRKFHIEELSDKKPGELSGGQQQRVALARVMAYEPKLILLDEPFSAMDARLKERLQIELEEMISDYNGMVIMVSHNRDELYKFSEEIIVVSEGKLVEHGEAKSFFRQPKTVKGAKLLGIGNILEARIYEDNILEISDWKLNIKLKNKPNRETKYIGIRDEDLTPIWDETVENEFIINIQPKSIYESINERKIFFEVEDKDNQRNEKENLLGKYSISIKKNGDTDAIYRAIPSKIKVDIDKIMFFSK